MIQKHIVAFPEGARSDVVAEASRIACLPRWPGCTGIKAIDDRVLWVVGETAITFYYKPEPPSGEEDSA
jgi:hypothetical protein